jgi:phosphate transport system substrate-binding protein
MIKNILAVIGSMFIATSAFAGEATGAGATFPQPIYVKWADSFKKDTSNVINYQGIGSGAGIKQIDAKIVTFGATDIPVKPEDLEKKGQVQFPMIVGGIVPIINLKEVEHLTLSVDIIAKIYMDKIKKWNDKEIADINPGTKLPDLPIIKVRRSDGSGTTWNFTKFLSEANADWKKDYGFGSTVEWAGNTIGGKGNDGVSNNVYQTNGSIGYVEYAFAKQNNLQVADMLVPKGGGNTHQFLRVTPGIDTFQTNWPMVATSYIVMNKESADPEAAKIALKFFEYSLNHDTEATVLDYVPLTAAQKAENKKIWSQIK